VSRATCRCPAYPWPHRPRGGLCRYPDAPVRVWTGTAGRNQPTGARRRSAIRRRLIARYGLHPIRDRALIGRWLPKLYVAASRRYGWPWAYWWLGGYVPAMLVTARGAPLGMRPENCPEFWAALLDGTHRRRALSERAGADRLLRRRK